MNDRMTIIAKALYEFWSRFGVPAFVENAVPEDQELPYITYRLAFPEWRSQMSIYGTVWTDGTSYVPAANIVDAIDTVVGECYQCPTERGVVMLYKDINFAQNQPQDDINVKAVYISLILEADL